MNELTRTIIDAVAGPVFVLEQDPSGSWVYTAFNRAARGSSGFRLEHVLGKTAKELYPGRAGRMAYDRHVEVARSKTALTYQILLPFGDDTRMVRTTLQPVVDGSGSVTHLVGTSHDLARDAFVSEIRTNAQALNAEIEEFVSIAAHDLRSPVRQVKSLTELLKKDFEDLGDGKFELIELLEKVALKSTKLMSEVLDYTQVARLGEEITGFAFQDLCTEIMMVLDPDGRHTLDHDEAWLVADRTALQIVIRNLIDNAIKHSGRDQVVLDVRLKEIGDGFLEFTAKDNGNGFNEDTVGLLESTQIAGNSGLGLASIRRLLKARGGSFGIKSNPGDQGAVVTFTFPGHLQVIRAEGITSAAPPDPSTKDG